MPSLTIRTKTLVVIACTMMLLIVVIGLSLRVFNQRNLTAVEQRFNQDELLRAKNFLQEKHRDLVAIVEAWGANDQTWRFVAGDAVQAPDGQMFKPFDVDFVLILDSAGTALYQQRFNALADFTLDIPKVLEQAYPHLFDVSRVAVHRSGLVQLAGRPLLVAIHPIVPSDHAASRAGLLVVARLLEQDFWDYVNQTLQLRASLVPLAVQQQSPHLDKTLLHARAVLNDIDGTPAFVLENDSSHFMRSYSKKGFVLFSALMLFAATVVVLMTQWLLEKLVLSRLVSLGQQLSFIGQSADEQTLKVVGDDELSSISIHINGVLNRLRTNEKIRTQQDQRFADMIEHAGLIVIAMDLNGNISLFNRSAEVVTGYQRQEVLGTSFFDCFATPQVAAMLVDYIEEAMSAGQFTGDFMAPLRIRDGQLRQIAWDAIFEHDEEGRLVNFIGFGRDVTDEQAAQQRLDLINKVFENTADSIVITDSDNSIIEVNDAFCQTTGYERHEVMGQNPRLLKSGRHDVAFFEKMWHDLLSVGHWEGEIWDTRKNGEDYPKWMAIDTIKNQDDTIKNFFAVSTDITKIKDAERRLHHLAYYDSLTDLPNRLSFCESLEQTLAQRQEGQSLAIIIFDLDGFKLINETFGPVLADRLLQMVADRLGHCMCDCQLLARMGGDEFALVVDGEDVESHLQKIIEGMKSPFVLDNRRITLTTSIGVALAPEDGNTVADLIKNADIALYSIKDETRNCYSFFHAWMNDRVTERMLLAEMLRDALDNQELELYYQPKIDLRQGSIVGAEALLRWNSRDGMIPPDRFIPIAEETGLIIPIGEWVLRQACRQASQWRRVHPDFHIGVNISPAQFDRDYLPQLVEEVLEDSALPPCALELEITEGMIIQNVDKTVEILQSLRQLGVELSIDDFGTGYSSLSYLTRLPLDILKIDRSFMEKVPESSDDTNVVLSILALARSLKLKVTAEGVETSEHVELLRQHDCDYIQGYHCSRPLPVSDFVEFLMKKQGRCPSCEGLAWSDD